MAHKTNWFPTLNSALEAEGLLDSWPMGKSMAYGETFSYTVQNGTRYGHFVSIYRNEQGLYERPIHYNR